MIIWRDGDVKTPEVVPSVATIGVFDGVHRGHQFVIESVVQRALETGQRSVVLTFDPHPVSVLNPDATPAAIATVGQRLEWFDALGVDLVRVIKFNEQTALESATAFTERVLLADLGVSEVLVGEDFHFGHDREGSVAFIGTTEWSSPLSAQGLAIAGEAVRWSSTHVREAVRAGDLVLANEILGRPFTLRGVVKHGDARGRDLGYPTANLGCIPRQLIPGIGIYAGAVKLASGEWWPGAISIGTRPQFYDDGAVLVEVHIPGFKGDLYDDELDVAFLGHLRGEMKFPDVNALIAQIELDTQSSLSIFRNFTPEAFKLLG